MNGPANLSMCCAGVDTWIVIFVTISLSVSLWIHLLSDPHTSELWRNIPVAKCLIRCLDSFPCCATAQQEALCCDNSFYFHLRLFGYCCVNALQCAPVSLWVTPVSSNMRWGCLFRAWNQLWIFKSPEEKFEIWIKLDSAPRSLSPVDLFFFFSLLPCDTNTFPCWCFQL